MNENIVDAGKNTEYAGFWVRVAANLIDQVILGVLAFFFLFVFVVVVSATLPETFASFLSIAAVILSYPLFIILFWVYRQATPGKMAVDLKIVDARSGEKPSIGQCIGRYFAYIPSYLFFGLGFLWVAFDKRKQGWHDKLAGTLVIKDLEKAKKQ